MKINPVNSYWELRNTETGQVKRYALKSCRSVHHAWSRSGWPHQHTQIRQVRNGQEHLTQGMKEFNKPNP